jgi:hypothetical protein
MVAPNLLEIKKFFVGVVLAAATCKAIEEAGITVADIRDIWVLTAMVAPAFVETLLKTVPDMRPLCASRIAVFLSKETVEGPTPAAESSAFVATVVEAAQADGASQETVTQAAVAAMKTAMDDAPGKCKVTRNCMLYGVELLRLSENEPKLQSKLKTAKLAEGGEWCKHLHSRELWDKFMAQVMEYLLSSDQFNVGTVHRLQKFQQNIPGWSQGGKIYVKEYFKKYQGLFPMEVDIVVLVQSQAEANTVVEEQLSQLQYAAESRAANDQRIKTLEAEMKALKSMSGAPGMGAPPNGYVAGQPWVPYDQRKCLKCGKVGHVAIRCTATAAEVAAYQSLRGAAGGTTGVPPRAPAPAGAAPPNATP